MDPNNAPRVAVVQSIDKSDNNLTEKRKQQTNEFTSTKQTDKQHTTSAEQQKRAISTQPR